MTHDEFVARYGAIYEASPWVAERAWSPGPHSQAEVRHALRMAVEQASEAERLALIRAHPELAGRTRIADLEASSRREQTGAGLDQCTPAEFEAFQRLNSAYNAKFGFPFVIAVKGLGRTEILAEFERRLENDPAGEARAAISQIHRIAGFRLDELEDL